MVSKKDACLESRKQKAESKKRKAKSKDQKFWLSLPPRLLSAF
jgi:hypothetical protein